MVIVLAFALVAGTLTILSPCILPVAALIVGSTGSSRGRRALGIAVGFAGAFVAVTVVLASTLAAAGVTNGGLRLAAAALLALFGAMLAVPRFGGWVETRLGRVLGRRRVGLGGAGRRSAGFLGGIALGAGIGLVWAPCVGPIMAAVIAAAVVNGPSAATIAIAGAYAFGVAVPLVLVALAGRRALFASATPARRARLIRAFGALTMIGGLLVASGLDAPLETSAAGLFPSGWTAALASVEDQPAIHRELDGLGASMTPDSPSGRSTRPAPTLEDFGPAPEMAGISAWINSPPLTLASLRGRVVLVHFWTFACINCIHVQPYVKAWYERYASQGLVVIGVHTPELSFERDLGNVRDAVAKDGVTFPVAFDPSFSTWNAYHNSYWPAFYFIDRSGRIRHEHFGEGDYDGSERVIRELLSEAD